MATATDEGLKIDERRNRSVRFGNQVYAVLQDYIPRACRGEALDTLCDAAYKTDAVIVCRAEILINQHQLRDALSLAGAQWGKTTPDEIIAAIEAAGFTIVAK